ncbi:MAG: hypothetical protein ACREI9_01725 [Nitrospiraceae bacterium]
MRREELEKLLGGYATGTLTAQERTLLFEAALADQALFNALAGEQVLKELLDNPHARRRLLTALRAQASRPSVLHRLREWLQPPAIRAVAGGLAVAVLAVTTVTRLLDIVPPPSEVTEDSYQTKSVDKVTAGKKEATPKKTERQEPMVALEKAVREADVKQNKDAERRASATAPQPDTKFSERPSVTAAPEAKTAPGVRADAPAEAPPSAGQPPATTATGTPVPSQQLMARAEAERPAEVGAARDLFYGTGARRKGKEVADRPAEESGSARDETRKSAPSLPDERIAAFGGLARPAIQRLGLRYGIAPREEGPALVVEVNQRGYLYAAARGVTGATTLVYPVFSADPQAALVEPGLRYFIPPLGALPAARLTLVLSRTPLADPTALAALKPSEKKDALLRQETTEPPLEGVGGPTVYVVEAVPALASSLSVEIIVPAR